MRSQSRIRSLVLSASLLALPVAAGAQLQIAARGANLTIGGRLHTQYVSSSADTAESQFFFRRARIQVDVRVNDFLDGRLESDFAGGRVQIADAYGRLTFAPELAVSIGQFKRAFSSTDLHSANDIPIIEREGTIPGVEARCAGVGGACSYSRILQQLQLDGRDLGVRLEGDLGERISYLASLTNGQGANVSDVNDGKSVSGRVELAASERIRIGVHAALHDHLDLIPAVDDSDYAPAFGADLEVGTFRSGFHLIAGVATGANWRISNDADFLVAQGIASWYSPLGKPRLAAIEPLFRVSWATPNRDAEDVAGLLITPGLMLYFQGRNGFAVNVDSYRPDGDRGSESSFKAQLFLYF